MEWLDKLSDYFKNVSMYRTTMDIGDFIEILIIALLLYYILVWVKTTRAWTLLKGIIVICIFLLLADFFQMTTILWIAQNVLGFAVTALIVVLQPELRKALEELGNKKLWESVIPFETGKRTEPISEKTVRYLSCKLISGRRPPTFLKASLVQREVVECSETGGIVCITIPKRIDFSI